MKLPSNEKFELYVDEEGDYVLRMVERPHHFIVTHGSTPNEAVERMCGFVEAIRNDQAERLQGDIAAGWLHDHGDKK